MWSHRRTKTMLTCLLLYFLLLKGHLSAPAVNRPERRIMELQLLFDPDFHKTQISLTDDYGEKPQVPILPGTEPPYRPNLEDDYY